MWLERLFLGSRQTIAGTVYGTIVVLSVLAAGAQAFAHQLWRLAVLVGVTVLVFWVAHVYSDALGQSLNAGRRLRAAELAALARHEFSIPLAAVLPITAVVLGALGVLAGHSATWLALAIGIATLTAQGARYARLEEMSRTATAFAVVVNLALGLVIVALKTIVVH